MKKYGLIIVPFLLFFFTNCDTLFNPEDNGNDGPGPSGCQIAITNHSSGSEQKSDGNTYVFINITVRNTGSGDCSCTLTTTIKGKNDQQLEKKGTNIGVIKAGESKSFKIETNVLYDDFGSYTCEVTCNPT